MSDTSALDYQVGGSHYRNGGLQHVEFCQKYGVSWCEAAASKYLLRFKKKNGMQDLEKARHYPKLADAVGVFQQHYVPTHLLLQDNDPGCVYAKQAIEHLFLVPYMQYHFLDKHDRLRAFVWRLLPRKWWLRKKRMHLECADDLIGLAMLELRGEEDKGQPAAPSHKSSPSYVPGISTQRYSRADIDGLSYTGSPILRINHWFGEQGIEVAALPSGGYQLFAPEKYSGYGNTRYSAARDFCHKNDLPIPEWLKLKMKPKQEEPTKHHILQQARACGKTAEQSMIIAKLAAEQAYAHEVVDALEEPVAVPMGEAEQKIVDDIMALSKFPPDVPIGVRRWCLKHGVQIEVRLHCVNRYQAAGHNGAIIATAEKLREAVSTLAGMLQVPPPGADLWVPAPLSKEKLRAPDKNYPRHGACEEDEFAD